MRFGLRERARCLLSAAAVAVLATTLASCGTAPQPLSRPLGDDVVVTGGIVRGTTTDAGVRVYQGIPFAAPPTGQLRWAPPAPVETWEGIRNASAPGPQCLQNPIPGGLYAQAPGEQSEDCLTLNVWTGAESIDEARPVMVWIHGGSLTNGTGSTYPGNLLASKGVVLVTINYRLGPFGFLAHPELSAESPAGASGNQGLRDQIAALEWVRDNIANFGGDPSRVTIFGESSGSASVSLLQASPLARGLIHGAIGQSGSAFGPMRKRAESAPDAAAAEGLGRQLGDAVIGKDGATVAEMRAVGAEEILANFQLTPDFLTLAIVDGEVIPDEVAAIFAAGEQIDVPVMIGSNADEATALLPYYVPFFGTGIEGFRRYVTAIAPGASDELWELYPATTDEEAWHSWLDFHADLDFNYPMRAWARGMETVASPGYLYWFTWAPPVPERERLGAFHGAEILYIFGVPGMFGATPTEADHAFVTTMSDIWVRFAETGNPNGGGRPDWPAYTSTNEAYMELGETLAPKEGLRMAQMQLIEDVLAEERSRQP